LCHSSAILQLKLLPMLIVRLNVEVQQAQFVARTQCASNSPLIAIGCWPGPARAANNRVVVGRQARQLVYLSLPFRTLPFPVFTLPATLYHTDYTFGWWWVLSVRINIAVRISRQLETRKHSQRTVPVFYCTSENREEEDVVQ